MARGGAATAARSLLPHLFAEVAASQGWAPHIAFLLQVEPDIVASVPRGWSGGNARAAWVLSTTGPLPTERLLRLVVRAGTWLRQALGTTEMAVPSQDSLVSPP